MSQQNLPLPIIDTVTDAVKITYLNLPYVCVISWISVIILGSAAYGISVLDHSENKAINILFSIFSIVVIAMVAVPWHRFVLLGEKIKSYWYFSFEPNARNYIAATFAIFLSVLLVVLVTSSVTGVLLHFVGWNYAGYFTVVPILFLLFWLMSRLSVVLPAKAIGSQFVTINSAWKMSQGYDWPLVAGFALCVIAGLPFYLIDFLIQMLAPSIGDLGQILASIIGVFCSIAAGSISLTFLSLAFQHIFELPKI